jgi:hypothetical protein
MALALAMPSVAAADAPADALRDAVRASAGAKTARVALTQRTTVSGRTTQLSASGVLAGGDSDVVVSGERGETRRVSVGAKVKERPVGADQPWRESSRAAPTQTTALGTLTLADGTSLGDPRLYRAVTDLGMEALASGPARKLVGELDMAAVAAAMRLSGAEATRMATWSGTLTLWVGADGRVARNAVRLVIPGSSGPTTIDAEVDLSDLDAPLTVTLP